MSEKPRPIPIEFSIAFERGLKLVAQGKTEEAEASYLKAAKLCPEAWLGVACMASREGRTREAILRFEQVLEAATHPKTKAAALNNLGSLLCNMALRDEALKYYEQSWACWKHQDSAANRAIVLRYQGKLDEAEKWIDKAIRIAATEPEFYFTRALIRLTKGDLIRGFQDYESRWKNRLETVKRIPIYRKEWNGENLHGKTILVYGEQGAGDTIQMLRYGPMLKAMGATALLAPQQGLGCVANEMGCWDAIHEDILQRAERGDIPAYDYQVPAMSLPRLFKTTLENLSGKPYLPMPTPDAPRESEMFRVGMAWAGSLDHKQDRWRSTSLDLWADLFRVEQVYFHSLQLGPRVLDLKLSEYPINDLSHLIHDYGDTARQLAKLDLVICVDTSVAHLAGAMGKPCWLLLPFSADWRWLMNREDSPWYDSIRIFRQEKEGEWEPVFKRVKAALIETISGSPRRVTGCESKP